MPKVLVYLYTYITAVAICHLPPKPTLAAQVAGFYADFIENSLYLYTHLPYYVILTHFQQCETSTKANCVLRLTLV